MGSADELGAAQALVHVLALRMGGGWASVAANVGLIWSEVDRGARNTLSRN